jgi:hypothetical protein
MANVWSWLMEQAILNQSVKPPTTDTGDDLFVVVPSPNLP